MTRWRWEIGRVILSLTNQEPPSCWVGSGRSFSRPLPAPPNLPFQSRQSDCICNSIVKNPAENPYENPSKNPPKNPGRICESNLRAPWCLSWGMLLVPRVRGEEHRPLPAIASRRWQPSGDWALGLPLVAGQMGSRPLTLGSGATEPASSASQDPRSR